jgi:RsmE family RNA methyltransferase
MRQFIASEQLKGNERLAISEKEVRYLKKVLRLKPGESIDVRLLDGSLLEMSLVKENNQWLLQKVLGAKKKERGVLANSLDTEALEIHLLQCEIKPQKMFFLSPL